MKGNLTKRAGKWEIVVHQTQITRGLKEDIYLQIHSDTRVNSTSTLPYIDFDNHKRLMVYDGLEIDFDIVYDDIRMPCAKLLYPKLTWNDVKEFLIREDVSITPDIEIVLSLLDKQFNPPTIK